MLKINKLILRWKEVIAITFFIRILLFIISILASPDQNIFNLWNRYDYSWYIDIARDWYQVNERGNLYIVFSPFYPILIKLATFLTNDFLISTILVSLLASFSASIALFELTLLDFSRRSGILAVWFLNIFPSAYFLQASYTESLFLTLSLSTLYLFRKNLFTQSGISGMLLSMTRLNGILLIPTLLMETKNIGKSLISFLLLPLGIIFYLEINYLTFNDPMYFLKPLSSNWYQQIAWPWIGINNLINSIQPVNNPSFYISFSELFFLLVILFFSIYVFLKVRKSYGIYMFINFLFYTSAGFIISTPRHALVLFPIFIALGTIRNNTIIIALSIFSLFMLFFYTILYTQGKWAF